MVKHSNIWRLPDDYTVCENTCLQILTDMDFAYWWVSSYFLVLVIEQVKNMIHKYPGAKICLY